MAAGKGTLILKGCPKCGGDLSLSRDIHGSYASCLQCGFLKDVEAGTSPGKTNGMPKEERSAA